MLCADPSGEGRVLRQSLLQTSAVERAFAVGAPGRPREVLALLSLLLACCCRTAAPAQDVAEAPASARRSDANAVGPVTVESSDWRAAAESGDWEGVAGAIDALGPLRRADPKTRYVRALAALRLGDFSTALAALEGLDAALPALEAEIASARARCQLEIGPFAAAAAYYEQLGSDAGRLEAARAWRRAGQPDRAARLAGMLLQARSPRPRNALYVAARWLRAELSEQLGELELARRDYRWLALTAAKPDAAQAYERTAHTRLTRMQRFRRASAFAERGEVDRVQQELAALHAAPGRMPVRSELRRVLGRAYYVARTDNAKAAEILERVARETRHAHSEDLFMAARARERALQFRRASRLYARIVQLYPGSPAEERARYLLAHVAYVQGRWAAAERAYTGYLRRYHSLRTGHRHGRFVSSALYERAVCQLAAHRPLQAFDDLERLAALQKKQRPLLEHLEGVALAASGRGSLENRAVERFEQVLARYPFSFAARASAARLQLMGREPRLRLPNPPALSPSAAAAELPPKAQLLARLGLASAAENVLREQAQRDPAHGCEWLCSSSAALGRGGVGYAHAAQVVRQGILQRPPTTANAWAWQCLHPRPYDREVARLERRFHLPAGLMHPVMRQESAFRPDALSPAGAVGLMQLLPATAERAARELSLEHEPERLTEANYNLELGAFYLGKLLNEFDRRVVFTLAGYNAGPRAVAYWFDSGRQLSLDVWVARIPFAETRDYVQHVFSGWNRYRYLAGGPEQMPRLALTLPDAVRLSASVY